MCQFIETICIQNGISLNLRRHQQRLERTYQHFWKGTTPPLLALSLEPTPEMSYTKARVVYDQQGIQEITYTPYQRATTRLLKVVHADIDYTYKSTDRNALNQLKEQRGECDDILIVKHGLLTDTSFCNIALRNGNQWYTPHTPLLQGTQRAKLLDEGCIQTRDIPWETITSYQEICLFNAMIAWKSLQLPIPPCIKL